MNWKKQYLLNTGSSYVATILRLALGLFLFRILFGTWDQAEFGFWSLLWSLFGFGILLDFGLGLTVQKTVGEYAAQGKLHEASRLLSTVLWTFAVLGAGLFFVALLGKDLFLELVNVPADRRDELGRAYLWFFAGLGVTLPLGLFPVMLDGLQRMDLANWTRSVHAVLHFCVMVWMIDSGWAFDRIMMVSMISIAAPNVFAGLMCARHLKGISLSPRLFDRSAIRENLGFSVIAYLITFSNLLLTRTDQTVVATMLGVAAVAIYQAGYKLSEMLMFMSLQIERAVAPAASHLSGRNDHPGLRDLLMRTSRLMAVVMTPCYLVTALYLEPLLRLLTGLDEVPPEAEIVGQLLIFAVFSTQITVACAKRVFLMSGHERTLLRIILGQAAFNLALSIALCFWLGIAGVAVATVISTVVFNGLFLLPKVREFSGVTWREWGHNLFAGAGPTLAVFAAVALMLSFAAPVSAAQSGFFDLAWRGAVVLIPCLLINWRNLRAVLS